MSCKGQSKVLKSIDKNFMQSFFLLLDGDKYHDENADQTNETTHFVH